MSALIPRAPKTPGPTGLSAYAIAVHNGFVGTEMEWILSLQGKSAYQLAVEQGFVGSLNDWIASLQGSSTVAGLSDLSDVFTPGLADNELLQYDAATPAWRNVAGPAGLIVGTTDAQTLSNKTINAALNLITTAAYGNLTAVELNAALAELQDDIDLRQTAAQVTAAIAAIVDASPATLDTLNELAAALGDDPNFAATMTIALGLKAPLASPAFTGTVTGITKAMVGLANVDNTTDAGKPVSVAQQAAIDAKENIGVAAGLVAAHIADIANPHAVTKAQVGLANVDNTSDANKPVSTAQQTALNLKANLASPTFSGTVSGVTKAMVGLGNVDNTSNATERAAIATLINKTIVAASNTITTAASGNLTSTNLNAALAELQTDIDTRQTAAQVFAAIAAVIDSSPATLDTLNELAAALGDDPNFATTMSTALGLKAPIASPTFTGTVGGITKAMVGLGSVDDTSDAAKPVSVAQAAADSTVLSAAALDATAKANARGDVFLTSVQTLTNKLIDLVNNTLQGTKVQFNVALSDDDFAFLATANTFTQPQVVEVTSASAAFIIRQLGAGKAFLVEDESGDTTPFLIDSAGRVNKGSSIWYGQSGYTPGTQLNGITSGEASLGLHSWTAGTNTGALLSFIRGDSSTIGDYSVVLGVNDHVGGVRFLGTDGVGPIEACRIDCFVDGTAGLNDMPGRMIFATTPDGAAMAANALSITSKQAVLAIGNGGLGYGTGSGGTVTQITSKATSVTLNKPNGQITTHAASLSAGAVVLFTLTNSTILASDCVTAVRKSGGTAGSYQVWCDSVAAGSCVIAVQNITAGALAEALVLQFVTTKGSIA